MHKWLPILCLALLSACAKSDDIDKERFQVNNNGTVLDTQTELLWADSDNRQSLTWSEAEAYCSNYTGGGHQDWRMPRQSELAALYAAGIRQNGPLITIGEQHLWAAENNDSEGAYCNFREKEGGCAWMAKVLSIALHILPVRDTKGPAAAPPSSSAKPQSTEQRLQILDQLRRQQLITTEEYNSKKATILNEL